MSKMSKYCKIEHSSESLSNNSLMLSLITKLIDNSTRSTNRQHRQTNRQTTNRQ